MNKTITLLVRLGAESQENRKRGFLEKLKGNLAGDSKQQDRLVEEFRTLILGH